MAATFIYVAALVWVWCSPGIDFTFLTWISLVALTGKPVFAHPSDARRKGRCWELGCWLPTESCAMLRSAVPQWGPLLPSEHAWGAGGVEGSMGMVSTLGLNFLALVPVLLLGF